MEKSPATVFSFRAIFPSRTGEPRLRKELNLLSDRPMGGRKGLYEEALSWHKADETWFHDADAAHPRLWEIKRKCGSVPGRSGRRAECEGCRELSALIRIMLESSDNRVIILAATCRQQMLTASIVRC
jgi:hypothetical protein